MATRLPPFLPVHSLAGEADTPVKALTPRRTGPRSPWGLVGLIPQPCTSWRRRHELGAAGSLCACQGRRTFLGVGAQEQGEQTPAAMLCDCECLLQCCQEPARGAVLHGVSSPKTSPHLLFLTVTSSGRGGGQESLELGHVTGPSLKCVPFHCWGWGSRRTWLHDQGQTLCHCPPL